MKKRISATHLRNDIYNILDGILRTGESVVIERKGKTLKIQPEKRVSKLAALEDHGCMVEDPEYYVHLDWSSEWNPDDNM